MMAVALDSGLRGEMRIDESMARHTSWRAGGCADRLYRPADIEDLVALLRSLPESEPLAWVGLGSNLLVRDGGIRGTVILTKGVIDSAAQTDVNRVRAEAGISCAKLARFCARAGLSGAEFLAGIPGTFGGALAMNAGAFGGETWPLVVEVETIDRRGELHRRSPDEYRVGYRQVEGPRGEWFVAATLQLAQEESEANTQRMRELLDARGEAQPIGQPSCGSVFRNPEGDHAARLIDSAGLKGRCIGGACVSEKHANFIINSGGATATDIEALIEMVAAEVEQQHGIVLQREVHIVGERGGVQ